MKEKRGTFEYGREKRERHKFQQRNRSRAWYTKNKEKLKPRMREASLKKNYGMTITQYEELYKQQNGQCAICLVSAPLRNNKNFAVDHDHVTKKVRGLLCSRCNSGMGFFLDNKDLMRDAIMYLERFLEKDVVNNPAHYTTGFIQPITFIDDQKLDFHLGNAVKYIVRARHKGKYIEDLQKAIWYLQRAIAREKSLQPKT